MQDMSQVIWTWTDLNNIIQCHLSIELWCDHCPFTSAISSYLVLLYILVHIISILFNAFIRWNFVMFSRPSGTREITQFQLLKSLNNI